MANKERLAEVARQVSAKDIPQRARFSCWARANDITPDEVRDLTAMNVVAVMMGLKSGRDWVLSYLKGNVTVEDNRRAVELLMDARIQTSADFIIGSPD
jgi:tRNA A37 methylthiotransferase MiaB